MAIVLKIGTNTLTEKGNISKKVIENIAFQIANLHKKGKKFIIVSSGAIGCGCMELGISKPRDISLKQAMAAIGQSIVMKHWNEAFSKYGIKVAQILLTYDDFSNRDRYLNLKNTLEKLLELNVIPIMNENDPLSINEINKSFGDNDKLSALVSVKVNAELLVLLSDINGFYDKDPKKFKDAKLIKEVDFVSDDIKKMCGKKGSAFSVGGMESKINAVNIANSLGVPVIICNGKEENVISRALSNDIGTLFKPHKSLNQKKLWIKEAKVLGKVYVDEGAFNALRNGKSLLPAGIVKIEGIFDCHAVVELVHDKIFGKAIVDFSSDALLKMMGKRSSNGAVIKRENMIVY
jgi:glutamate 5-kinase